MPEQKNADKIAYFYEMILKQVLNGAKGSMSDEEIEELRATGTELIEVYKKQNGLM